MKPEKRRPSRQRRLEAVRSSASRRCLKKAGSNRGERQIAVDGLQTGLPAENDICGIFARVHAPVAGRGEIAINRAAQSRRFVQPFVWVMEWRKVRAIRGGKPEFHAKHPNKSRVR